MFSPFLITFRETLEAALVVGIILSLLAKTNQKRFNHFVYKGIGLGVVASVVLALLLEISFGGLEGLNEKVFEGTLMFITAGFLTWMILWVHRQRDIVENLKKKVSLHLDKGYGMGILLLTGSSIFREGTETVLYLKATTLTGMSNQLFFAVAGVMCGIILGFLIFSFSMKIRLSTVFTITNVFLLFFAAGLISHGVHEFQEIGILPIFSFDPLINISSILDHKSTLGSILRTLFGYTSKPTILELVSYMLYIGVIIWLERLTSRIIRVK